MCGCTGKKIIIKICNTEDVFKVTIYRNNLISCHNIPVRKASLLSKIFITFYSITTIEEAKANGICDSLLSPPTTEEAQATMLETEVKTSPNTCQACLLFRCHCQALQSDGHVPQALLKCCNQVSLKVKPYRSSLFSPPKQEYFCRYLNGPPSARHCLLWK